MYTYTCTISIVAENSFPFNSIWNIRFLLIYRPVCDQERSHFAVGGGADDDYYLCVLAGQLHLPAL